MRLEELPTPAAVVDLEIVERNVTAMTERVRALGARLRPHVKTHKCVEAARLQVAGNFGGITVSTLAEARHFAESGFSDITYAVPIAPGRLAQAAKIARRIERLSLVVDSAEAVARVQEHARIHAWKPSVFIEVDCGDHRSGVDPLTDVARGFASALAKSRHVEFRGLLTHAGQSYRCRNRAEIAIVAAVERDTVARLGELLRADGIDVPEVSIGSTPTLAVVDDLSGVTEARPGNYIFFDRFQADIGSCSPGDIALTVSATVIGRFEAERRIVLDAGALALSKDPGATHIDATIGYGRARRLDGADDSELTLSGLSQEHGVIEIGDDTRMPDWPIGCKVRVQPNHSCLTAAMHDQLHVVRGGEVVDHWRPIRGW